MNHLDVFRVPEFRDVYPDVHFWLENLNFGIFAEHVVSRFDSFWITRVFDLGLNHGTGKDVWCSSKIYKSQEFSSNALNTEFRHKSSFEPFCIHWMFDQNPNRGIRKDVYRIELLFM